MKNIPISMALKIDYKKIIDEDLGWNPSPEEFERFRKGRMKPPIVEVGLYHPVFYAFQARVEWEVVALAEELGEKLIPDYDLQGTGDGIRLDWNKLGEKRDIWIPADYSIIKRNDAAIFTTDEANLIFLIEISDKDKELWDWIIYGPLDKGKSEAKVAALIESPEWRECARQYSQRALHFASIRYLSDIKDEKYLHALEALVSDYKYQMK